MHVPCFKRDLYLHAQHILKNSPTTNSGHDKAFLIDCLDDGFVPNQDRTGSVHVLRRSILVRFKTLDRYNLDQDRSKSGSDPGSV